MTPQSFTLVNLVTNREVHLLAIPSPDGWGFIQIGDGSHSVGEAPGDGFAIRFESPVGALTSTVEVRYADGTVATATSTSSMHLLGSGRGPESVVSVQITHAHDAGAVITAS